MTTKEIYIILSASLICILCLNCMTKLLYGRCIKMLIFKPFATTAILLSTLLVTLYSLVQLCTGIPMKTI